MKNDSIRDALDRRLSFLDSSPARQERIRQRIENEEAPAVKRKITASLVFIVIAALALVGVALALGVNLFDFFGKNDVRLSGLAPDAELATHAPIIVESDVVGSTRAEINSAYYDGTSLIVGYIIDNTHREEEFTPDAEMLSKMQKDEQNQFTSIPYMPYESDAGLKEKFNIAVYKGTPFGIVLYSVSPSDHTYTDDGIDLPPATENQGVSPDGEIYYLREYETPLPNEALDRDVLNISIALHQYATYYYFDGEDGYFCSERTPNVGEMTASIPRTDAERLKFSGAGTYNGNEVVISVEASAVYANMTIACAEGTFPDLNADNNEHDRWYDIILLDENGNEFDSRGVGWANERLIEAWFDGTAKLPQKLFAEIVVRSEGEYKAPASVTRIELLPID